jgi:hypothetical protein
MDEFNIFKSLGHVTSRIEPFHSRVFSDFLQHDAEFCERFIKKFVPTRIIAKHKLSKEEPPRVTAEDNRGAGERIDITLSYPGIVVGIEIKTSDSSTTQGQLIAYHKLLTEWYPGKDVFMIYLTPFNRDNIRDIAPTRIHAISEFESYKGFKSGWGIHINWEEAVAMYPSNITRDIGVLYKQHASYMRNQICDFEIINTIVNNRELALFLGDSVVAAFFDTLKGSNIQFKDSSDKIEIPLSENIACHDDIISSLNMLMQSDHLDKTKSKRSNITKDFRAEYERTVFGEFFRHLFRVVDQYGHLWLQGKASIGLRAAHKNYTTGVSICTLTHDQVNIVKRR